MRFLPLILILAVSPNKAKLSVSPHFAAEPATVVLLLTNIPEGSKVACVALDGNNYYGGCYEIQGRQSIRVEYKQVRQGIYTAGASIDDQVVATAPVRITGVGDEPDPLEEP